MEERLYRPSGKTSPMFFLLYVLVVPVAAVLLSFAYIYLVYYIPFVYLNLFIAIGCGILCGTLVPVAWGKMRNKSIAVISGLIAALLMKYLMWLVYIPLVYSKAYQTFDYDFLDCLNLSASLFFDPRGVFAFIREINGYGVWSIRRLEVRGVLLYIVWLAELFVLAGSCIITTVNRSQQPYSEDTGKWFQAGAKKIETDLPARSDRFKDQLLAGDSTELQTLLSRPMTHSDNCLRLSYYYLEDLSYGYVTAEVVTREADRKGKVREHTDTILSYVRVDYSIIATLKAMAAQPEESRPATDKAV